MATAAAAGFQKGAKAILDMDGACCASASYCFCLNAAIGNERWAIIEFFKPYVLNEESLVKMIASYWGPERRAQVLSILGFSNFTNPYFLNALMEEGDTVPSAMMIGRELKAFPHLDLNKCDETNLSPFFKFLISSTLDLHVFTKMISLGADPLLILPSGASALDILQANEVCDARTKAAVARHLYRLGVRSTATSSLKRTYLNLKVKINLVLNPD